MTKFEVFKCAPPEGFEVVLPVDSSDFAVVDSVSTRRVGDGWRPIVVEVVKVEDSGPRSGLSLEPADLPWWGSHVLVLSERAVGLLGAELRRWGELLPLECDGKELWLFNCLTVVDALDEDKCELKRFDSGRIMRVKRHAFFAERLAGVGVFKLPQFRVSPLFATADFVAQFRQSGLNGSEFGLVWSSSEGGRADRSDC